MISLKIMRRRIRSMLTINLDSIHIIALVCALIALMLEAFTIGLLVERRRKHAHCDCANRRDDD